MKRTKLNTQLIKTPRQNRIYRGRLKTKKKQSWWQYLYSLFF